MKTFYFGHEDVYCRLRKEGAAGWEKTESAYAEQYERFQNVLATGHAPRSGRLLELGCGAGNMSIYLASLGYEVTGVDISPTAIDWARERSATQVNCPRFLVADVLQMECVADAEFDFVLDGHCFHCIIGDDRQRFLYHALRALKPGGFMLVNAMCAPGPEVGLEGYDPTTRCIISNNVAIRYIGLPESITKEVAAAGFHVVDVQVDTADSVGDITIQATKPGKYMRVNALQGV